MFKSIYDLTAEDLELLKNKTEVKAKIGIFAAGVMVGTAKKSAS